MDIKLASFPIILSLCMSAWGQNVPAVSDASIKADVEKVVCKNDDRLESVRKIFVSKGATEDQIKTEKIDGVTNLSLTKKGKSSEMIVIGAHYDKVSDGCGAIDNWTGIVILANLYASLRDRETEKTLVFVAFGKEEDGLVGSKAMVKNIPKANRIQYCTMVNLDSFGFYYPQVLASTSTPKLTKFTLALAEELKMPSGEASLAGVADTDSSSFKDKDIPAITLHGLSDKWQEFLHGSKDTVANVNIPTVLISYRFSLILLTRLDMKPCAEFRK